PQPLRLPTEIRRAAGPQSSSTRGSTSASCTTTSASPSARAAATVNRSGSPSPAPTRVTLPASIWSSSGSRRHSVEAVDAHGALLVVGFTADGVELVAGEAVRAAALPVERNEDLPGADDPCDPHPDPVDLAALGAHLHPVARAHAHSRFVGGVHLHPRVGRQSLEDPDATGL